MCKAPVKLSPPTNQHPIFYRPDALLVTQLRQSTEGKSITFKRVYKLQLEQKKRSDSTDLRQSQWRRSVVKSEGVRVTQVKPSN